MALSPVSIQTQSLALRALRKRKPQETQALALASSQSWLPLLRPSGFLLAGACVCCAACQRKRLHFLRFSFTQRTQRKRLRLNGNWALTYAIFLVVVDERERQRDVERLVLERVCSTFARLKRHHEVDPAGRTFRFEHVDQVLAENSDQ